MEAIFALNGKTQNKKYEGYLFAHNSSEFKKRSQPFPTKLKQKDQKIAFFYYASDETGLEEFLLNRIEAEKKTVEHNNDNNWEQ